ncbi:MAG: heme-binding protein, partial [Chthoniobacterales bacterium]
MPISGRPTRSGFALVNFTPFRYNARMRARALLFLLFLSAAASSLHAQLTATDVQSIINQATRRANRLAPNSVIAVTDREGYVLGVWVVRGGEPTALEVATAVGKAGTAAFLSSGSNAFTSRTAGYIIQQHFPPGVMNLPPGPLVGVGFSNLPFSDVNRFKKADFIPGSASPGTLGSPIPLTSLNGIPGGLPLYKNNILVGGIGVTGSGLEFPPTAFVDGYSKDEDIALVGQLAFMPSPVILASDVFIGGISLPYVSSSAGSPAGGIVTGNTAAAYPVIASPAAFPYPTATFATVSGQIRQPIISDPISTPIHGQPRLTAAEVTAIITLAADRVRTTRAGIRLPVGQRMEAFITVVNNPDAPGVGPTVLGTFRTGDATLFSWDVAVQKARTAVGYSSRTTAFSTRTVGFLAETHYPPGIDPQPPGPFYGMQEQASGFDPAALPNLVPTAALLSNPPFAPNPTFPDGITIFPGGFPLYRNGELIGAIGVSGDGVDQDDLVSASGTSSFLPPDPIRADQFNYRGTRLPYAKFPRDPEGGPNIVPVILPTLAALAADFNHDAKADLVWQNNLTGERGLWLMDHATPTAS